MTCAQHEVVTLMAVTLRQGKGRVKQLWNEVFWDLLRKKSKAWLCEGSAENARSPCLWLPCSVSASLDCCKPVASDRSRALAKLMRLHELLKLQDGHWEQTM